MKDYYSILGITNKSSADEIKKAYKKLVLEYHPDRNSDSDSDKFKEINEAFSILGDEKKKNNYDKEKEEIRSFATNIFNFNENLGEEGEPGEDIETKCFISLKESVLGVKKSIQITYDISSPCEQCAGTGAKDFRLITCQSCQGRGKALDFRVGKGPRLKLCLACNGTGRKPIVACLICKGTGKVKKKKEISIKIPPGINSGQKLRLSGLGNYGFPPGDLYVEVEVHQDDKFARIGQNLFLDQRIFLLDALQGVIKEIETISGKKIKIEIPPGIQQLHEIVIQKEGVLDSTKNQIGNLHIRILIEMPQKLSLKAKQLLEEFAKETLNWNKNE